MQNDGDYQVQAAIQHLQQVFEESKKQRNDQIKILQDRVENLEQQLAMAHNSMQQLETDKAKVEADLNNCIAQNESLKSQNQALIQALQEKDEQLNRFVALNQNLKNLIDQTQYTPIETKIPISQYNTDAFSSATKQHTTNTTTAISNFSSALKTTQQTQNRYNQQEISPIAKTSTTLTGTRPIQQTTTTTTTTTRRTASKSSLFIKAAKEELSPNDFNHMISEINMYNKKSQSREETIANVKRLLGSAHRALFEQFLPMVSGA